MSSEHTHSSQDAGDQPKGDPPKGRRCCENPRHARGGGGRGALAEPAVLAALMQQGSHGYDLRKAISEMTHGELQVDTGGLYRVLRRLEEDGYVRSSWAEGDTGPQRREYEITPEAHKLAEDWIEHLRERQRVAGLVAEMLQGSLVESNDDANQE